MVDPKDARSLRLLLEMRPVAVKGRSCPAASWRANLIVDILGSPAR
jgi:hypothetical protein